MRSRNPQMDHGFFTNLPPEITMSILLRVSIESISSCKYVCKSWFNLVESPEFAELHPSTSVPGLVIFHGAGTPNSYVILEYADEISPKNYAHYFNVLLCFDFPHYAHIHSSVNGLLFMYDQDEWRTDNKLFVCNPITRDYIELPTPSPDSLCNRAFGFGVSKMTGQYKVVMSYASFNLRRDHCEVYTLGTRSWRSIEVSTPLVYHGRSAVFLNGNLHWLGLDSKGRRTIACLDLETEYFSAFRPPRDRLCNHDFYCFSVLGDCLCISESGDDDIVVWLLKDYGDEKSWTKEFVIRNPIDIVLGYRFPIKVFEDGKVLIADEDGLGFWCYSKKTRAVQIIKPFDSGCNTSTVFYTPSFFSVKMLVKESVRKF